MSRYFLFAGLFSLLSGCVSLQSVSVTSIPMSSGKSVEATAESGLLFLGIRGNSTYVDDLVKDLRKQCEGGTVTGILTKFEGKSWPLFIKYKVTAKGDCNL